MLHPALTNELGVKRFQAEIRIAAGLHHPNIIGVHESGEADGRLFYVMDYLDRDGTAESHVLCELHRTHRPASEFVLEPVAFR